MKNREIKFRGLDEYKHFVYGSLFKNDFATRILPFGAVIFDDNQISDHTVVNSNTVGQFTGIKDKNGKEIYEWDIVKKVWNHQAFTKDRLSFCIGLVEFGRYLVINDSFGVDYYATGWFMEFDDKSGKIEITDQFEVIGNIHENPELLNT